MCYFTSESGITAITAHYFFFRNTTVITLKKKKKKSRNMVSILHLPKNLCCVLSLFCPIGWEHDQTENDTASNRFTDAKTDLNK